MIKEDSYIIKPENQNEKIWRYLDFTKFVSLLDKKSLFFCRVDKLGDQFEMTRPKANYKHDKESYAKHVTPYYPTVPFESFDKIHDIVRQSVLINSWHRNEYESAAMWSQYLNTHEGLAIQSTFNKLEESLSITEDEILIGIVRYIDYQKDSIDNNSLYGLVTHKLQSYKHEQELRAIIIRQSKEKITNQIGDIVHPLYQVGKYVEVNLNTLIEKIYIAPNSPDWFKELTKSIIKQYKFDIEVVRSSLNDNSLH
jgi:hypothetical protein